MNSLLPRKELNPYFWPEGTEGKINPEVRFHLLKIAKSYKDSWDLNELGLKDVKVTDVHMEGSLANYNWSDYSDIDLHIIVDYSAVPKEYKATVEAYLMALKNLYNTEHNIKIHNFEVEVYPEDSTKPAKSAGVYSLIKDEWIAKPEKEQVNPDREYIKDKVKKIIGVIDLILSGKYSNEETAKLLDTLLKKLKKMRQAALDKKGEYAENNLVFKVLRRLGYQDKLRDLKTKYIDKDLSLPEWRHPLADYVDGAAETSKEEYEAFLKRINPTGEQGINRAEV